MYTKYEFAFVHFCVLSSVFDLTVPKGLVKYSQSPPMHLFLLLDLYLPIILLQKSFQFRLVVMGDK